jgi:FKBP-type peptidyl-prolyl cis-trans isomerase
MHRRSALVAACALAVGLVRCAPSTPSNVSAPVAVDLPAPTSDPSSARATPPSDAPTTSQPSKTPPAEAAPLASFDDTLKVTTLTPGSGAEAAAGDLLEVNYVGTLLDGTEFDSSTRPGRRPFRFKIGKGSVIKGWEQGLLGMKVGEKRRLVIPPGLAYGSRGRPGIPANSTLTFEVELLAINPP